MPSVHYLCAKCEWRLESSSGDIASIPCPNCATDNHVVAPRHDSIIESCASCQGVELYIQKDFNRATGLAFVVVGAVFVPWTYGLSLLAVTIVDVALFRILKDVQVCYECRAVHRGYQLNPSWKPFDLVVHDRHVYGQAPPGAEEGH